MCDLPTVLYSPRSESPRATGASLGNLTQGNVILSCVSQYIPAIPALRGQKQEGQEFYVSFIHLAASRPAWAA